MYQIIRGLVIRAVDYREADRILTVFSPEAGKITVRARGVRRKNSALRAAAQLFAYSEMILFEGKGRLTLNEASVIEQFSGLGRDLWALALASYLVEVLGTEAEADAPHPDVLRLTLNALHALSGGAFGRAVVKAAFELRYAALIGYEPDLSGCAVCGGSVHADGWFEPRLGLIRCNACPRSPESLPLDGAALSAARYILSAPVGRVFSFRLGEQPLALLSRASERYLLSCLERGFRTLDYYNNL